MLHLAYLLHAIPSIYNIKTLDDARKFVRVFDPSLNVPLPERGYANDCRIYTPENPTSKFSNIRVYC
jgi:hypothetical protein